MKKDLPVRAKPSNGAHSPLARAIRDAQQRSTASGDLVVQLPERELDCGDGVVVRQHERWVHNIIRQLELVEGEARELAMRTGGRDVTAVAHIVRATIDGIIQRDADAVGSLHAAARAALRAKGKLLPVEDSKGREIDGLTAGFDRLAQTIADGERQCREAGASLALRALPIASTLATSFPRVISLAQTGGAEWWQRAEAIAQRIRPLLIKLQKAEATNDVEAAAANMAAELLELELKLSGWESPAIRKALKFLDRRAHRTKSAPSSH